MRFSLPSAAGLALAAALTVPCAAWAHPGVYTVVQKIAPPGVIYPNAAGLTDRTQYAVANDGYALGFTETTGSGTQYGMIDYKKMPGTYRANMTSEEKRSYAPSQTVLQAHATCEGVDALDPDDPAGALNVLAWQEADPFFNYIPWQKTGVTVGPDTNLMGEDPVHWIPVVKAATAGLPGAPAGGVDLSALTTTQEFTDACTALGGTYHVADVPAMIASTLVANAVAPLQAQITALNAQIASLNTQVAALTGQAAGLQTDKDALAAAKKAAEDSAAAAIAARTAAEDRATKAEAALAEVNARPLTLALSQGRTALRVVGMITGKPGASVTLTLRAKQPGALGLKSAVLMKSTKQIGRQGALLIGLSPVAAAARAITRADRDAAATLVVESGGTSRTAAVTITG